MADKDNDENEHDEVVSPQAGEPIEQPTVTGRPADTALANSTFGSRTGSVSKAVDEDGAENKSVSPRKANSKRK